MTPTHYLCPRCRAEGLSHDCAQPQQNFELHATLTFPVPLYAYGMHSGNDLARELNEQFMDDPKKLRQCLQDVMEQGEYDITVQPVFVDP